MLNIQLLTYNVTVLDTTTMLVTILLVCLCSRHNKGRFWSLFGVLDINMIGTVLHIVGTIRTVGRDGR